MTDTILKLCLETTHPPFITALFVCGFVFYRRDIFARALILLLFTLIFNPWLKSLWHVPLPPSLDKQGWAFPSGHMQMAFVLYTWLAWEFYDVRLSVCIVFLLTGVGIALVYFGYHYPFDIAGAVFFGLISNIAFALLLKTPLSKPHHLSLLTTLVTLIGASLLLSMPAVRPHSGIALGALLGFSFGWYQWPPLVGEYKRFRLSIEGLIYLILIGVGMGVKWYVHQKIQLSSSLFWQNFWLYGATAVWISYGLSLSKRISACFQRTTGAR